MGLRRRRFLAYLVAFLSVVVLYTGAYIAAMAAFEGESRSVIQALLVVVETFTTTGYGEDAATWGSPAVIGLMIVMQFTGVLFIFMALPLFVVPWIEQRLSTSPPSSVEGVEDHVVICAVSERVRLLMDELDAADVPFVVVEPDPEVATDLVDEGLTAVQGDPETEETLANAGLSRARALVADVDDEANASIALAGADLCEEGGVDTVTFAEDADLAVYHRYAGADTVLTPRHLVAESLGNKVTASASAEVGDAIEIGDEFEIAELPVEPDSDLAGRTIEGARIGERTGANVLGAWFRGEFQSPPDPGTEIDARTILLVAGREAELERLKALTRSETRARHTGPVIVCGYGEVGSTITNRVRSAGMECTVVDRSDAGGVEVVGDATDHGTLERAGIAEANTVILALSDDTDAVFATLVIRELAPDVQVVARANHTESVRKLYRAGADYVLALDTVSGRMLASSVLEEDVISYDQQVEVVRMPVGDLAGETLAGTDVRSRTGCTVIAIERDGEVITDFDPSFRFRADDRVVVAGPDENVAAFTDLVGAPRARPVATD